MGWTRGARRQAREVVAVFRFRSRPARRGVVLFAAVECVVFLLGAVLTAGAGRNPVCAAAGWILLAAQMPSIGAAGLAAVLRS